MLLSDMLGCYAGSPHCGVLGLDPNKAQIGSLRMKILENNKTSFIFQASNRVTFRRWYSCAKYAMLSSMDHMPLGWVT